MAILVRMLTTNPNFVRAFQAPNNLPLPDLLNWKHQLGSAMFQANLKDFEAPSGDTS